MSASVNESQMGMRNAMRLVVAWFVGWVVAYTLGSISQSVFILHELTTVSGGEFPPEVWLKVIAHDLQHLAFGGKYLKYGGYIMVAFAVAFPCAIYAARLLRLPLILVAAVAGATAIVAMISIVMANSPANMFSGTRGVGMLGQIIAGAIGGAVFFAIFARRPALSGETA